MSGPLMASYVVLWVLVAAMAVALFALYHHFGEMYLNSGEGRQTQGPDVGALLKRTRLLDLGGTGLEFPPDGRPVLMYFAGTNCRLCKRMREDIRRFATRRGDVSLVVVCTGPRDDVVRWARPLDGVVPVVPDVTQRLTARFNVGVTPFVVAVDGDRRVRTKGVVNDGAGLDYHAEAAIEQLHHAEESVESGVTA